MKLLRLGVFGPARDQAQRTVKKQNPRPVCGRAGDSIGSGILMPQHEVADGARAVHHRDGLPVQLEQGRRRGRSLGSASIAG